MDTNLISAFLGRSDRPLSARPGGTIGADRPAERASVTQLIDVAEQNAAPLANVAAGLGTNLDISC